MEQETSTTTGPPGAAGVIAPERYQPPAVAWEEFFEPVAATSCNPGDGSGCADWVVPPGQAF